MTVPISVLCVDDDAVIRELVTHVLSRHEFDVRVANCGERAMETLSHTRFDVVVTDFEMPGITGIELAEYISVNYPGTPVVLQTGNAKRLREIANRTEFAAALAKPWTVHDFLGAIEDATRK